VSDNENLGWGMTRVTYRRVFWNFLYCSDYDVCPFKTGIRICKKLWWVPKLKATIIAMQRTRTFDTFHLK
jgi:hypothetical protein